MQSDWLGVFLHLIRDPDFSELYKIIKVIMLRDLNPRNLHINGLYFCKIPKTYFWSVFGHYPQCEIFSQKSSSVCSLAVSSPNFKKSFRITLWAVLQKTCLPIDLLTCWHTDIIWHIFTKRWGSKNQKHLPTKILTWR